MTILEMLQQSSILTVLGMAVVFVFLWIMIICVTLVGRMFHSMGLDKDVEPNKPPAPAAGAPAAEIATAISAAVVEYRKTEEARK
jgi:oxaloacetate decarboxylase gamma subunit